MGISIANNTSWCSCENNFEIAKKKTFHFIDSGTEKLSQFIFPLINSLGEFFYQGTIFHALNNERLAKDRLAKIDLPISQKIWDAVVAGVRRVIQITIVLNVAVLMINALGIASLGFVAMSFTPTIFEIVVIAPLIEELLFRGCLHNFLYLLQKKALQFSASKTNWIFTPAYRNLITTVAFTAIHFGNAGVWMTTAQAILQMACVFIWPTMSVTYETTDSLSASIAMHMTNNFFAVLL